MTSQDLSQPFSGNQVIRHDNVIVKHGKTVGCEWRWYDSFSNGLFIPSWFEYIDGALRMEFIKSIGPVDLIKVIEIVEEYKNYPRLSLFEFEEYRQRIKNHLDKNPIPNGERLLHKLQQIDLWPTFAHGDLSIRNIIQAATGPKLIDPLYGPDRFGSFILDYAKLAFTLKFFNNDLIGYETVMHHAEVQPVLIASECVRVATYNKRFNFIAENLVDEL